MPHHRLSSGYGSDAWVADLVSICIVLMLVSLYILVRTCVYVIVTFLRYPRAVGLWVSLAVFLVLCLVGWLLSFDSEYAALYVVLAAALELLLTCMVVRLKYADTFMREDISIVDEVLHRSWWADDDTLAAR